MVWISCPGWHSPNVVNRLNQAMVQAFRAPEVRKQLSTLAEVGAGTPKEFTDLIASEYVMRSKVVKSANIKAE